MKTKTFILLSLLICNLLPAQNVKLDIKPHFLGVRADSLFVSMDISVEIEDMNPKNAVILTPILTGQDRKILLPAIQLNGKQKQKLYVRNQILRKKKNSKESNTAYLVTGIDDENCSVVSNRKLEHEKKNASCSCLLFYFFKEKTKIKYDSFGL
jgi:hypothetical protein